MWPIISARNMVAGCRVRTYETKTGVEGGRNMPGLLDYLPDAESLLALGPEDLGLILLELVQNERQPRVALSNIEMPIWNANTPKYPQQSRTPVARAIAEAWQWLQN